MKRFVQTAVMGLACLGMAVPQTNLMAAAPKAAAKQSVQDVALAPGGAFFGHVVDEQGNALEGAVVKITQGKRKVAETVTDKTGLFVAKNLRGGVFRVVAGQADNTYRFWAPETAPPSALTKTVMVSSSKVVRGQLGGLGALGGVGAQTAIVGGTVIGGTVYTSQENDDLQKTIDQLQKDLREIEEIVTF